MKSLIFSMSSVACFSVAAITMAMLPGKKHARCAGFPLIRVLFPLCLAPLMSFPGWRLCRMGICQVYGLNPRLRM